MPLLSRARTERVAITAALPDGGGVPPAELVRTVVQHVLFMHQQIPCVYTELQRDLGGGGGGGSAATDAAAAEEEGEAPPLEPPRKRRRLSALERKAVKLLNALDPILDALHVAVAAATEAAEQQQRARPEEPRPARPMVVAAIVLGASVASPRLVYLLGLHAAPRDDHTPATAGSSAAAAAPPPAPARPRRADGARRLLRAIATQGASLTTCDPGLCRMHLLLRAPRDAHLPPAHFRPRPGLHLKLQRAHVATVTGGDPSVLEAAAQEEEAAAADEGEAATTAPRTGGASDGGGGGAIDDGAADRASPRPPPWLRGLVSGFSGPPARREPPPPPLPPVAAFAGALSPLDGPGSADLPPAPLPVGDECADGAQIWWQTTGTIKGFRLPQQHP